MPIERHISSLLYDHECVIVPGFGGFVTNYAPAHYNEISQVFNPPSYRITFNQQLKNNDGLLINFIREQENCSYDQAKEQVAQWVEHSHQTLKQGIKLHLSQIGILSLNKEGKYHFYPDEDINYLKDAFGLSAFRIKQISSEKATQTSTTAKVINITHKDEAEANSHGKKTRKYWVAASILILIACSYVVTFHSTIIPGVERNYSSLIPQLFDHSPGNYEARNFEVVENHSSHTSLSDVILKSEDNLLSVTFTDRNDDSPIVVRLKENLTELPTDIDNTEVAVSKKNGLHYHVIGGCFSVKSNAKKLVKKLRKLGYDASIIGRHKNLYAVSYESYATREEALTTLASVRNNHNDKAWLLDK